MIQLRPHYIRFKSSVGGGRSSDGEPIPVTEVWTDFIPCRYETSTKTNFFYNADGTRKYFPYVVWMDRGCADYTGRFVRIYDGNRKLVKEGQVHHCPFRQLHTLLYVE